MSDSHTHSDTDRDTESASAGAQHQKHPQVVVQESTAARSPGTLLAAARRSRELSRDEVGDALNLAPQTIEWLEADDFESLPAAAFTQGYIRNYAKFVGLDADDVVAAYQTLAGKPAVAWESPGSTPGLAEMAQRHPGLLISVVVAAVVLLIVIVLAVVWPAADDEAAIGAQSQPEIGLEVAPSRDTDPNRRATLPAPEEAAPEAQSDSRPEATGVPISGQPGPDGSADARRFDDPGRFDREAIDPNDPLAHLPVAKTYPVTQPTEAPLAETAGYRSTINRRLTPAGNRVVRLEVIEDCWIAVKDVADKELFSTLGREGQTINLTGEGPFKVLLGYAPGASLYLDDRQILLAPYTRNNVASLVIGQ